MKHKYNRVENFEYEAARKKLIIFPASRQLDHVLSVYPDIRERIVFIWDNNKEWDHKMYEPYNIPVKYYEPGKFKDDEYIILLISHQREIYRQLNKDRALENVYVFSFPFERLEKHDKHYYEKRFTQGCREFYQRAFETVYFNDEKYMEEKMSKCNLEKLSIPNIQLVLTTKCTLNCKECFALVPYCRDKKHYALADILKEIDLLLENIDECICMELIGGEPFLYPYIKEVIRYCIDSQKIGFIEITTNGTIVPEHEVLDLCRNPRVLVTISEYDIVKSESFINTLNRYGIKNRCRRFVWTSMGVLDQASNKIISHNFSREELCDAFEKCGCSKWCYAVLENKLFVCYRSAMLWLLDYPISEYEYVDLSQENGNVRKNIEELCFVKYSEGCNYCGLAYGLSESVEPGVQCGEE